jgi:transcriptional regulator with XRE-family HTH domain
MPLSDKFPEYSHFERCVADALRAQRKKAGLSLKEMSERVGMHYNTLSKCENKGFGLGLDILYGYARVCDLPISAFINPHDQPAQHGTNPLLDLNEPELIRYSELLQDMFRVFSDRGMKLSGEMLYEATRLVAAAIREQRVAT